jgi:hypothetical protein
MNNEILKGNNLEKEDLNMLREKFIIDYSKQKGWNYKELTSSQMLEIVTQKEYKTPGIILG